MTCVQPTLLGSSSLAALVLAGLAIAHLSAQGAPPAASPAKAKDLVTALQGKQLEAFAVPDAQAKGRYIAVLHQPGIQLLVISAAYERSSDMDYRFYNKDYMNAYLDLRTGVLSTDRVFIEDAGADGLVAFPGKNLAHDAVLNGPDRFVFDGTFADPKKKDPKKVPQDEYMKRFAAADEQYTRFLGMLVEGLKK